jgi:hypothetical protein
MNDSIKNISKSENTNQLVEITAIISITILVIFAMFTASHTDPTNSDFSQAIFFLLMILVILAIKVLINVTSKSLQIGGKVADSMINVYGGSYTHESPTVYNTANNSSTTQYNSNFEVPSNYFDVIRAIEQVPVNNDAPLVGLREILLHLQYRIEALPDASLESRRVALEKIAGIAITAVENPQDPDLQAMLSMFLLLDRRSELWSAVALNLTFNMSVSPIKLLLSLLESNATPKLSA